MRYFLVSFLLVSGLGQLAAQQLQVQVDKNPGKPHVAVPDFRGSGSAGSLMTAFNQTVADDLQGSPLINFIPKTLYPLQVPQQPSDLITGVAPPSRGAVSINGHRLSDWSLPPVLANYLGMGYGAEDRGMLVVFGEYQRR